MQQILGVFGYLEMDAGQGGDFGFYILLGVRLEFGNYPTIRASPNSQRRFLISGCSSMKGKG